MLLLLEFMRWFAMFLALKQYISPVAVVLFIATHTPMAMAGVVLSGTRVIYPMNEKEVTLKVTNKGKSPVLIQNWIDDGDARATPDKINVPFIITPPINRIDPSKGQTLRISYTGTSQPKDRESLYWLDVLEAPANPAKGSNPNYLQVAFRTRIKIFLRPDGLKVSSVQAASTVKWSSAGNVLTGKNDSPYFVSLEDIHLGSGTNSERIDGQMIEPFSSKAFTAKNSSLISAGNKITYRYLNDWGAVQAVDVKL